MQSKDPDRCPNQQNIYMNRTYIIVESDIGDDSEDKKHISRCLFFGLGMFVVSYLWGVEFVFVTAGCLGRLAGWLASWLAGWLAAWPACCCASTGSQHPKSTF